MEAFRAYLREHKYRLILAGVGCALAILCLTIGFFRTILILLLTGAGFALGLKLDASDTFDGIVDKIKSKGFRRRGE